jgi:aspartyl-tRNA(Asn)/glutamyl-tRNA(Gln) amidotransferase subunit B
MVSFLQLIEKKTISNSQAKIVMKEMLASGDTPQAIIVAKKFDEAAMSNEKLTTTIQNIIDKNPDAVADYHGGKETAIKFLMGQVMRETKGQVSPGKVLEVLTTTLS